MIVKIEGLDKMVEVIEDSKRTDEGTGYTKYDTTTDEVVAYDEAINGWVQLSGKFEPTYYKVLPEYLGYWGRQSEMIVDLVEIVELANEWETTVEKLMEQVEEI